MNILQAVEHHGAGHITAVLDEGHAYDARDVRSFSGRALGAWMANNLDGHAAYSALARAGEATVRAVIAGGPRIKVDLESLDATLEQAPNPGWLREFAGAVKFEAAMLEGHQETAIDEVMGALADALDAAPPEGETPAAAAMRHAVLVTNAVNALQSAAACLVQLADSLVRKPRAVPFGEAHTAAGEDAR